MAEEWYDSMIDNFKMIYSGGDKHERSVGLLLDQYISKCVLGYWTVSDRVLLVKIQGNPFNITIIVVYAPTTGSTEEEIDAFFETLEEAKSQCKPNEVNIIIGGLNAKVGSETDGRTVGPHGTGERNEQGEKWVQWCDSKNMVIMNTWFKEHPRKLYTWKSPRDHSRNQTDYIAINSQFKRGIKGVKMYPRADCGSDHVPVVAKFQCKLKESEESKECTKAGF